MGPSGTASAMKLETEIRNTMYPMEPKKWIHSWRLFQDTHQLGNFAFVCWDLFGFLLFLYLSPTDKSLASLAHVNYASGLPIQLYLHMYARFPLLSKTQDVGRGHGERP